MATFEYNALTSARRLMKGTIEAGSREEAGELLKQMQLTVNSIEKAKPPKPKTAVGRNEFLPFIARACWFVYKPSLPTDWDDVVACQFKGC